MSHDLRLNTELVRLQQNFLVRPSRVELVLRMQLIDVRGRNIVATTMIDETQSAPSDDAYGGVVAANAAVQRALEQAVEFCVREAGSALGCNGKEPCAVSW